MDKVMVVTFLKMALSLALVLSLFAGAVLLFRKFAGSSRGFLKKGASAKPMEILAYQSLGPGKGLFLVRCLNKKILVGATGSSISHLTDMTEDELDSSLTTFGPTFDDKIADKTETTFKKQLSTSLREISRV